MEPAAIALPAADPGARLHAEATGAALKFSPEVQAMAQIVEGESESFAARQRALNESVESTRRSVALVQRELAISHAMAGKGLMSEVEVMRLRRQVNELNLQNQERINRYRQQASAELVRVHTELSRMEEQMVLRDDMLPRLTLVSPVRGMVKQIRMNTLGGVVGPGAPVMEIVSIGPRVLVEARIKPSDIGFVKVGQEVQVKLTAYDYTVCGGLLGVVQSISPDALSDPDRAAAPDGTWYRAADDEDAEGFALGVGRHQRPSSATKTVLRASIDEPGMQFNILEAKTQLSKLVDAALRGEEVVIANRGKPAVRLVKVEPTARRRAGAWAGLMTEAEIDHAFSLEVDAQIAREWLASIDKPIDAGLKSARPARPALRKPAR